MKIGDRTRPFHDLHTHMYKNHLNEVRKKTRSWVYNDISDKIWSSITEKIIVVRRIR